MFGELVMKKYFTNFEVFMLVLFILQTIAIHFSFSNIQDSCKKNSVIIIGTVFGNEYTRAKCEVIK